MVKLVRPGIEETVRADIRLLKQLATLLAGSSALGRRLHPQEVIADYEVWFSMSLTCSPKPRIPSTSAQL